MKSKICLKENKYYYAIKKECTDRWNIGLIEKADGTLANNKGRTGSIAGSIRGLGGNFHRVPKHPFVPSKTGASKTCGGTTYEGWVVFGSLGKAIDYLDQYFNITYC